MKKAISVLLCAATLVCGGTSTLALDAPEYYIASSGDLMPRFSIINKVNQRVKQSGQTIECTGICMTNSNVNINVTITFKDNATGNQTSSSGRGNGSTYSYTAKFNVTSGKTYTIVYAYNAGGEKTSVTKSFTAK